MDKRGEYIQEACDWIEYCNGPATSKWGRIRAANGHPEPYNVKYWEIDNETWFMRVRPYCRAVRDFVPPMKKKDPSIKIAVCGSGGFNLDWNREVIETVADLTDYLSIHHYENPNRFAGGPWNYERFIRRTGKLIAESANPKMKIYCSEWNAQSTDWRTGLYAGGMLNGFERCSDIFEIGGPALFLRHATATAWDNAFINFDHRKWFPAPNYVVMKLWRSHYAPFRIAVTGQTEPLNIVGTKSADGTTLYLKCVNPEDKPAKVKLEIKRGFSPGSASMQLVAPDSLEARNTLDRPRVIQPEPANVRISGRTISFTMPRWSAAVVKITNL
ncbi:MAG: alpha-L-arabinofuranosidase C-terminal domain-containing protein [Planctomycetota bacterium]